MRRLTINEIKEVIEQATGMGWEEIIDGGRVEEKVYARYLFAVELDAAGISQRRIGRELQQCNHTTAHYYLHCYQPPRFLSETIGASFKELKKLKQEGAI